jgi:hypothetical protein
MGEAAAAVLAGAGMGEGFGEAGIGKLAPACEVIEEGLDLLRLAVGGELAGQIGPAVLAPGEVAEGALAEGQGL